MTNAALSLVDIGANLGHQSFNHDLDLVVARARAAGVKHVIVTGTDLESVTRALELARHYRGFMTVTAGFHPHVASSFDTTARAAVEELARLPEVVAIGETGLDFNRNYSPPAQQEKAFAAQLELAVEHGKPVFLHQRDAHDSFLAILKQFRPRLVGGVVHCFTDTRRALYDYLDLDMYIGITGWICDERRGQELQLLAKEIPVERLLLETDAPYLLPRSLEPAPRGRRNEPAYLPEVLRVVALCSGRPAEEIAFHSSRNADTLFGLGLA